jgi:hypothetical protein
LKIFDGNNFRRKFLRSFSTYHPLGKRKLIRIVESKIPKVSILSILKMGL